MPVIQKGIREFNLLQTNCLWDCLHSCWSAEIFLQPLTHKFWKLNLLLASRYTNWLHEIFQTNILLEKNKDLNEYGPLNVNSVDNNINERAMNGTATKSAEDSTQSLMLIVALAADIHNLMLKLPLFVVDFIHPIVCKYAFDLEMLTESVEEIKSGLDDFLPKLGQVVIDSISSECCIHLKSVYDIPRLFRRTNREMPTKPSIYVTSTLKPLQAFLADHQELLPDPCQQQWIKATLINIADQYFIVTREVLTSVKKMEDSLKRLKKARDKQPLSSLVNATGISDDDKIRLQLVLDVEYFGKQISSLGIESSSISSFSALVELVESARISPSPSS